MPSDLLPLGFPYGFRVAGRDPLDHKYGPYATVEEAIASVLIGERGRGLTVNVNGTEYWWKDGPADAQLVVKASASDIVVLDTAPAIIEVNMGNAKARAFNPNNAINAAKEWVMVDDDDSYEIEAIPFSIGAGHNQKFPNSWIVFSSEWRLATKIFTPVESGIYFLTGKKIGGTWWMTLLGPVF